MIIQVNPYPDDDKLQLDVPIDTILHIWIELQL